MPDVYLVPHDEPKAEEFLDFDRSYQDQELTEKDIEEIERRADAFYLSLCT